MKWESGTCRVKSLNIPPVPIAVLAQNIIHHQQNTMWMSQCPMYQHHHRYWHYHHTQRLPIVSKNNSLHDIHLFLNCISPFYNFNLKFLFPALSHISDVNWFCSIWTLSSHRDIIRLAELRIFLLFLGRNRSYNLVLMVYDIEGSSPERDQWHNFQSTRQGLQAISSVSHVVTLLLM